MFEVFSSKSEGEDSFFLISEKIGPENFAHTIVSETFFFKLQYLKS